jgi:arylsulfatase A
MPQMVDPSMPPPNCILILMDDLGWAELGCCGNQFNATPELDRLAAEGIRFTQAYSTAPVCSPARASLMTGLSPVAVGITDYLRPDSRKTLDAGLPNVAAHLRSQGYRTGLIGKWHLGGHAAHGGVDAPPQDFGFDEVILSETRGIGKGSYHHPYAWNPEIERRLPEPEHLIDRQNAEAVDFVKRHSEQPFFLVVSHYAVHTVLEGRADLVALHEARPEAGSGPHAKRNNPHLAAQLGQVDHGVGLLRQALVEAGVADQTVIIFSSDHGGEVGVTTNQPLRAGKSHLYEGGLRVPLLWHGPSLLEGGRTSDAVVSHLDFFPTIAELIGCPLQPATCPEARSMAPLLRGESDQWEQRKLYWHYPLEKPHFLGGRSASAAREGDLKWIEFHQTGERELYDLSQDPGETRDLSAEMPAENFRIGQAFWSWLSRTEDQGAFSP